MGEQQFPLRPPPYEIDLTGDGHGHHIAGTPDIYSHGWHPLHGAKAPKFSLKSQGGSHAAPGGVLKSVSRSSRSSMTTSVTDAEGRQFMAAHSKHLDSVVSEFAGEDGTQLSSFHVDVHEWKSRWDSAPPHERAKMTEELEAHLHLVNTVVEAAQEDLLDQHRNVKVGDLKKFDGKLAKTAAGRALIKVRDKLVSDGVLNKYAWLRKQTQAHGIETAGHILTGLAAATICAHLLGTPLLAPILGHLVAAHVGVLTGDRVLEGIVAACVSMHVTGKLLKPLERLTSREHKIEKAKKRLRTLEAGAKTA